MYDDYMENVFDRNRPPRPPRPPRRVGDIFMYRVRAGDNVYRIARMFNTKIEYIACMNGLNSQFMLQPDQELLIPVVTGQMIMPRDEDHSYELYF